MFYHLLPNRISSNYVHSLFLFLKGKICPRSFYIHQRERFPVFAQTFGERNFRQMLLTRRDLCSLGEQLFRESTNQFYPDGHQEDYYQDVQPSNSPAHTLTCSMPPYAHSPELGCIGSIVQEYCFYGFPQELFCAYLYVVYHGCIYRFKIYALICRGIQLIREEYLPLSLPSAFENSV